MSIRLKLSAAFGLNLLLMIVLGGFAIVQLRSVNTRAEFLGHNILPATHITSDIRRVINRYRGLQAAHIAYNDQNEYTRIEQEMRDIESEITNLFSTYETFIVAEDERAVFNQIRSGWSEFLQHNQNELMPASQRDDRETAIAIFTELRPIYDQLINNATELLEVNQQQGQAAIQETARTYESSTQLIIGLTFLALLLATGSGTVLSMGLTGTIRKLADGTSAVASGDLTRNIEIRTRDELGRLANSFNQMIDRLRESRTTELNARQQEIELRKAEQETRQTLERTVADYMEFARRVASGDLTRRLEIRQNGALGQLGQGLNTMVEGLHVMTSQVQQANANIAAAAAEILAATTQQAASAAEQSAAITQTSTTVEEVKAIAQQTAQQAQQVARESQMALDVARQGTLAVEETVGGMGRIREKVETIAQTILSLAEQTQAIGAITATVTDLADQSNLLALNAAIEAARAGEQGKSFAVVAQHVRELAERSKQATAQVGEILGEIQRATNAAVLVTEEGSKGVDTGSRMASEAGQVIHRIATEVEHGAQANVQMAAAAQQQTMGMEQIGQAMTNIQQATTQALASTRQAERAAQDLHELARSLQQTVASYRL